MRARDVNLRTPRRCRPCAGGFNLCRDGDCLPCSSAEKLGTVSISGVLAYLFNVHVSLKGDGVEYLPLQGLLDGRLCTLFREKNRGKS